MTSSRGSSRRPKVATPPPSDAFAVDEGVKYKRPGKGAWFDVAAADRFCQFVELFCVYTKAEWAGKPFVLAPWQRAIVRQLFGWKRPDGLRWYRRLDLWIPRKNGKSEITAIIALYCLYADHEPSAEVYVVANSKEQAAIVFKAACTMIKHSPELQAMSKTFDSVRTKAIVVAQTMSSMQAVSAEPKNKDGLNPSCVVFDELHELTDQKLWDKMTTADGARRQPLLVVISTAGNDRNSIGYREYSQSKRILQGRSRIRDRLVYIFEASPDDDWKDPKTWAKANPGLGISVKLSKLQSMAAEAKEDEAKEAAFKRYHLNIWVGARTGWIEVERWDACARNLDFGLLQQCPMWIGLDLSKRSDLTAATGIFKLPDSTYAMISHGFVPGEEIERKEERDGVPYRRWAKSGLLTLTPGACVEYSWVRDWILLHWARKFDVREIAYDPYQANLLVSAFEAVDLTTVEVIQTVKFVSPATALLKALVMGQKLIHDGSDLLRWQIENVAVIKDINENERLTKKASTSRIDNLSAGVTALSRASVDGAAPSVYETRGVQSL